MDGEFTIREIRKEDLNELLELHHLLFPVKYNINTMNSFLKPHYLSLILTVKNKDEKEKIIGVSVTRRRWSSFFSTERFGYLCTFGIHPDYRKLHLGTDLLHTTTRILKNHYQCSYLSLHMQRINEIAFKFYIKFGFKAISVLPDHYSFPGDEATAVFMTYDLKDVIINNADNNIKIHPDVESLFSEVPKPSWFWSFYMDP